MECLLQYLDDIDDLAGALGLFYEPIRRLVIRLLALAATLLALSGGFLLTITYPPVAFAIGLLLVVALIYRLISASPRHTLRHT